MVIFVFLTTASPTPWMPSWMPTGPLASNSLLNPKKDIMKEFSSHLGEIRSSPLIQEHTDNQKNYKVTAISVIENQK